MITKIDVESENAFFIPVLGCTPKDSLLIRKVTGLNPPDPNLFIGEYSRDGGTYQGRRVGPRNVVVTMELNPNPALGETASGLRRMLYRAFMDPHIDADYIKLNFHDEDGNIYYVVGYTEKFETDLFDIDTMAQISIICPDPYIRDNTETVLAQTPGWTVVPAFAYEGTAETGFEATIHIDSITSVLTLELNGRTMVFTKDFAAGDIVEISTIRGSRSATVTPSGGSASSIVASLSVLSPWLELHSQSNSMKVYGVDDTASVATIRELRFTQAHWGL